MIEIVIKRLEDFKSVIENTRPYSAVPDRGRVVTATLSFSEVSLSISPEGPRQGRAQVEELSLSPVLVE